MGGEQKVLIVQIQIGGRVIQNGGLVDVDVQALGRFHLKGRLHTGGREALLRGASAGTGDVRQVTDLGEFGFRGIEFLGGIVSGNPPGGMVSRHGKLCLFFLDLEIGELVFQGELVAETQAIVIQAEADLHHGTLAVGIAQIRRIFGIRGAHTHLGGTGGLRILLEGNQELVIMVADRGFFSPYRFPGFIFASQFHTRYGESGKQIFLVQEFKAQAGGLHHHLFSPAEGIQRGSFRAYAHGEFQNVTGTLDFLDFTKLFFRSVSAAGGQ